MPPDAAPTTPAAQPAAAPPAAVEKDVGARAIESTEAKARAAESEAQNEWNAAKEKAAKLPAPKLENFVTPDEDADTEGEPAVAAAKEGEEPAAVVEVAESEAAAEPPKEPEKAKATGKDWKEFLARKEETERRLKNRESRIVEREAQIVQQLEQRERAALTKIHEAEQRVASLKLDSDDPYEVWQSLSKWKGWDATKMFNDVTRRTVHGGELTVEDQLRATETKFEAELRKRDEAAKAKDQETERLRNEAESARAREYESRVVREAHGAIAAEADGAFKAGKYRLLQAKYTPQQVGEMAYNDMLRYYLQTSRRDASGKVIPGTGEEVPLDKYLDSWEHNVKQDYERLHRAASSEGSRANPNGSEVGQGNGAPQGANPGTQQANGSQQRGPKTVTRSLAAQRSELNRPLSDAEQWEEAKRVAAQRNA